MTGARRAVVELLLAGLAAVGAVFSASSVRSVMDVAPIIEGEPATTSVAYHGPWLVLTLLLVTVATVLIVVAGARWRRERPER